MMKRFVAGLAGIAMAASIFTFGSSNVSYAAEEAAAKTADEAIQIAIDASKYTDKVIKYTNVWEAEEDGTAIYKVEFYVGKARFSYHIDAATGEIIKKEVNS